MFHLTRWSTTLFNYFKVRKTVIRLMISLILVLPTLLFAEPLSVFVSIQPVQTFVKKIGGEHVDIKVMVPPGHHPHHYNPSAQQIAMLSKADLYVRVGLPFEEAWMARVRVANQQMRTIDLHHGIEPHKSFQHKVHADETDPHIWTSPVLVKQMTKAIVEKLVALDPSRRSEYQDNQNAFVQELDELDQEIQKLLKPFHGRKFLVFHPAWGYFADQYGLIQVAIEHEGKEPNAKALARLIDQAKKERIKIVFVQPQVNMRLAKKVAQAIGGNVITVDPLASDYIDNLRYVAEQFAGVL
jgi:zinc transport system substrate-binding protein